MADSTKKKRKGKTKALTVQGAATVSIYDNIKDPLKAALEMAKFISESGFFGNLNLAQGQVLAWHCISKKRDPIDFRREFHIHEDGNISKRYEAMLAQFLERGGKVKWLSDLNDKMEAKAQFISKDGDDYTWSFKIEDAKGYATGKHGIKNNWRDSAPDMLRSKLVRKAVNIIDPGITYGLYTPEEVSDFSSDGTRDVPGQELFGDEGEKGAPEKGVVVGAEVVEAEVVETEPGEGVQGSFLWPEESEAPPAPVVTDEKDPPGPRTVAEKRDFLKEIFVNDFANLDLFAVKRGWIEEGDSFFLDGDDSVIESVFENLDKTRSLFDLWKTAEAKKVEQSQRRTA